MQDVLLDLARSECGKRFLINVWEGLNSSHIVEKTAKTVIGALTISGNWDVHKKQVAAVIFGEPELYQYTGPASCSSPAEWMTIKSMSDLLMLLRGRNTTLPGHLQRRLGIIDDGSPHTGMEPEHYIRFAELLSDPDEPVSFLLAKCFSERAAPSWYSRWDSCDFRDHYAFPSIEGAGRFRDWLGLTYGSDDPLFVVRSRSPISVDAMKAHRPTAWDGFDNPFYKHHASADRIAEFCGSTADLDKVRLHALTGGDIEGGPEIVSRGIFFDPEQFLCDYLGPAPEIPYDPYDEPFHALLLQAGRSIDWVVERVAEIMRPSGATPT